MCSYLQVLQEVVGQLQEQMRAAADLVSGVGKSKERFHVNELCNDNPHSFPPSFSSTFPPTSVRCVKHLSRHLAS